MEGLVPRVPSRAMLRGGRRAAAGAGLRCRRRASWGAAPEDPTPTSELVRWDVSLGGFGVLHLDRPRSLNAANASMCRTMGERLASSPVPALLLRGCTAEGRLPAAFCAGGDLKALVQALREDPASRLPELAMLHEYRLIEIVHRLSAQFPSVALLDGVCMGFGVGLAYGARHRIATERSVFAMPECAIGIQPDVSFSFIAAELPTGLARCMALTGRRLSGTEALRAGLATHLVHSARLPALERALLGLNVASGRADERVLEVLDDFDERGRLSGGEAAPEADLDGAFAAPGRALDVRGRLEAAAACTSPVASGGAPWVTESLSGLHRGSPVAQEVSMRLMDAALLDRQQKTRHESLVLGLERDFKATLALLRSSDFTEGVRATLLDRCNKPAWSTTLEEVDMQHVARVTAETECLPLLELSWRA